MGVGRGPGVLLLADGIAAGLAKVVGFIDVELDVSLGRRRGSASGFVRVERGCGGSPRLDVHFRSTAGRLRGTTGGRGTRRMSRAAGSGDSRALPWC